MSFAFVGFLLLLTGCSTPGGKLADAFCACTAAGMAQLKAGEGSLSESEVFRVEDQTMECRDRVYDDMNQQMRTAETDAAGEKLYNDFMRKTESCQADFDSELGKALDQARQRPADER